MTKVRGRDGLSTPMSNSAAKLLRTHRRFLPATSNLPIKFCAPTKKEISSAIKQ
ncbi:hypothetical protein DPMN_137037 [Dreissena polymorpha]|uniref:Uncharacterized protein n=1 Tax=Dreissena polymorpha TaxID=45954 RepID=A0A9D4G4Z2_DREPO|nr:hypothetical protein DPMN_137037 [Dreissena polymorpha]